MALSLAAGCAPLFTGRYLPMVDLPQHAAQISIINHFPDPMWGFQKFYVLNWYVPYALGYFLTAQAAKVLGLFWALKLSVMVAVAALPLALLLLLRETQGDPWWSLLGIPLAYSFSFYWGFLSYIVAIPVGLVFLAFFYRHLQNPTFTRNAVLFCLALLTFFSHAIVYLMCGLVAGVAALSARRPLRALLPLLATVPFVLAWYAVPSNQVPQVAGWTDWGGHEAARIPILMKHWLSNGGAWMPAVVAVALLTSVVVGARLRPWRWMYAAPVMLALILYETAPHHAMDISFIFQRLGVFVPIFLLMMFLPSLSSVRRWASRTALVLLVLAWSGVLWVQFKSFNLDAKGFDAVTASLKMNKNTLGIIYDHGGVFPFEGVFGHFPAYAQALKGGGYSFSFATSYKSVARSKPLSDELPYVSGSDLMDVNEKKSALAHRFDCIVVRSIRDRLSDMNAALRNDYVLLAHQGPWWAYQKKEVNP